MVESVKPTADGTQAEVTYTAMDNSRNVTKKKLMVNYQASGEAAPADSGQAPEGTEEGQESGKQEQKRRLPKGKQQVKVRERAKLPRQIRLPTRLPKSSLLRKLQAVQRQRRRRLHSFRPAAHSFV